MISIEVRGIPCVFNDGLMDDIELLEVIADLEGGDMTKLPLFFRKVFGDEQYCNIKDSLRGDDGICKVSTLQAFYREAMEEAARKRQAEAKN